MGTRGVTLLIVSTTFCKWDWKWTPRATLRVKAALNDRPGGMSVFPRDGCTLDSKQKNKLFLPLSKDGKGNSRTPCHCPAGGAIFQIHVWTGNYALWNSPQTSPHTHTPVYQETSASTANVPNPKWHRRPTEDLHLLALHPFSPLILLLHILFRKWPRGRLNDWPQLSAPPYIHALRYVTLLFLLLPCCRQEMFPSLVGRRLGCVVCSGQCVWVKVAESAGLSLGSKKQQFPLTLHPYHHYEFTTSGEPHKRRLCSSSTLSMVGQEKRLFSLPRFSENFCFLSDTWLCCLRFNSIKHSILSINSFFAQGNLYQYLLLATEVQLLVQWKTHDWGCLE